MVAAEGGENFWGLKIPKSRSPVGRAPVLWVPRGRRASPVGARPVGAPKAEDTMSLNAYFR